MGFLEKLGGGLIKMITKPDSAPMEKPKESQTPEQILASLRARKEEILKQERAPGDDAVVRQLENQIATVEAKIRAQGK